MQAHHISKIKIWKEYVSLINNIFIDFMQDLTTTTQLTEDQFCSPFSLNSFNAYLYHLLVEGVLSKIETYVMKNPTCGNVRKVTQLIQDRSTYIECHFNHSF